MDVKKLIYHGSFILALSSLLTIGIVYAQQQTEGSFPLGPMPKLIVFGISVIVSIIVDSIIMLALDGQLHIMKSLIMSIPWAFLNIYWFDYIAPATGNTLFTMRFIQLGDPSWNYWIGINWIVVFLLDFLVAQVIFRFARGAAPSPNSQDAISAAIDVSIPAILFIVLPMVGII